MVYTKVFQSGNSQAIRIPKAFRLHTDEVGIIKKNNVLIIREKPTHLGHAFQLLTHMPDDFFHEERQDDKPEARDFL
jgi:antitoxin VapB